MNDAQMHRPLVPDGFQDIDEDDIDKVFVRPRNTPRRRFLASGLRLFLAHLRSLGLDSYEIWVNGSFATEDPNPMDIDIVCFIRRQLIQTLSEHQLQELRHLGSEEGRPYVRERWGCDYYHCPFDSLEDRSYWKGLFSSDKHGSSKGIIRIAR